MERIGSKIETPDYTISRYIGVEGEVKRDQLRRFAGRHCFDRELTLQEVKEMARQRRAVLDNQVVVSELKFPYRVVLGPACAEEFIGEEGNGHAFIHHDLFLGEAILTLWKKYRS